MIVMAHRGYSSKAPENTMPAFELALEAGSGGIELDVHLTKDGEVVVIHDNKVDRTTNGEGPVGSFTMAELRELDAGSWFSSEFKGTRIPTLREVLELIKDHNVLLNVETKASLGFEQLNDRVAPLLDEYGMWERTIISSFNHYALVHMKAIRPQARTGILYNCGLVDPWVYAKSIGASALHPHHMTAIPELVQAAQQNGMMVNVWTVDEADDIERVKLAKVDSIITNVPGRVQSLQ
ncbi:MAG TPA: glycerophosphodiester phosphodiesterase [Firmicutes bacterium]|nr:glycerophosphodiester phosphodiesterase [Bacillota bacterium]